MLFILPITEAVGSAPLCGRVILVTYVSLPPYQWLKIVVYSSKNLEKNLSAFNGFIMRLSGSSYGRERNSEQIPGLLTQVYVRSRASFRRSSTLTFITRLSFPVQTNLVDQNEKQVYKFLRFCLKCQGFVKKQTGYHYLGLTTGMALPGLRAKVTGACALCVGLPSIQFDNQDKTRANPRF